MFGTKANHKKQEQKIKSPATCIDIEPGVWE